MNKVCGVNYLVDLSNLLSISAQLHPLETPHPIIEPLLRVSQVSDVIILKSLPTLTLATSSQLLHLLLTAISSLSPTIALFAILSPLAS